MNNKTDFDLKNWQCCVSFYDFSASQTLNAKLSI